MATLKILGIVLIAVGILALVHQGFTYTQETHKADLGPIEFKVKEKKTVNIPMWAGIGSIAVGAVLLVAQKKN